MATARAPCSGKLLLLAALSAGVFFRAALLLSAQPAALQGLIDDVHAVVSDATTLVAKLLLQWSLVLVLLRARALSKPRAVAGLALSALALAGSVATLASISSLARRVRAADHHAGDANTAPHLDATASLLRALELTRHGASVGVNTVLARGYQVYLCGPWPSACAQWRRIPKYLGSKDLVVATLFFMSALVGLVSVLTPELRALGEAAAVIEALALAAASLHLLAAYASAQLQA